MVLFIRYSDSLLCLYQKIISGDTFLTTYYTKDRLPMINDIVKYDDVYSSQWNSETDIDLKRRKEAELLVRNDLPSQFVRGFVVYNEGAKQRLMDMGVEENVIVVAPGYYF